MRNGLSSRRASRLTSSYATDADRSEYSEALMWDQLKNAMKDPEKNPFPGFQEHEIDFPPTFKYDVSESLICSHCADPDHRSGGRSKPRTGICDGACGDEGRWKARMRGGQALQIYHSMSAQIPLYHMSPRQTRRRLRSVTNAAMRTTATTIRGR